VRNNCLVWKVLWIVQVAFRPNGGREGGWPVDAATRLARPRAAGKPFSENGLRGACEFYTHTTYTVCTPPSRQASTLAEGQKNAGV
jgi:hypothetical protein